MTAPEILAIAGVAFLAACLLGGGFRTTWFTVPIISRLIRISMGVVGVILVCVAIINPFSTEKGIGSFDGPIPKTAQIQITANFTPGHHPDALEDYVLQIEGKQVESFEVSSQKPTYHDSFPLPLKGTHKFELQLLRTFATRKQGKKVVRPLSSKGVLDPTVSHNYLVRYDPLADQISLDPQ